MRKLVLVINLVMVALVLGYMISCGQSSTNIAGGTNTAFSGPLDPAVSVTKDSSARAIAPGGDDELSRRRPTR
jgi:hypothetical protein